MKVNNLLWILPLSLAFLSSTACSEDKSSKSDSDSDSNENGDTDADSEEIAEASCLDLGAHLSSECGMGDAEAAQLIAGCAMISSSFSQEAMGPLLGCLVSEDCSLWADQTGSMTAFTMCAGEVAGELPPSAAAEEFIGTSCEYQSACAGGDSELCAAGAPAEGEAIIAILDEQILEEMAGCIPALPDCSTEEQDAVATCIQESLPLSMLAQLP